MEKLIQDLNAREPDTRQAAFAETGRLLAGVTDKDEFCRRLGFADYTAYCKKRANTLSALRVRNRIKKARADGFRPTTLLVHDKDRRALLNFGLELRRQRLA